jgi:hypothetical protein
MQHKKVSRDRPEHDKRAAVKPVDESVQWFQREIFIGRERDDVPTATMIEIAGIGVMQRVGAQPESVRRQGDDANNPADPIIGRASFEVSAVTTIVLNHE